ncbi:hypothetical protein [Streptomyces orinoci]|uniref:Hok/Gef family protein n=1 Tax=Streptomyces orinoci TaxID=67339 RepID=A0ABV3K7W5_STRON|nr:hypothetical protein [Streptomyces orinoci]
MLKIAAVAMAAVAVVSLVILTLFSHRCELRLIEPGMDGAHCGAVAVEQE